MDSLQSLDRWIFHLINSDFANSYFDLFFPAITDLHKTDGFKFLFLPILLFIALYYQRLRGACMILGISLSLAVGDTLGRLAKHFWQRPRPFEAGIDAIQRSGAGGFSFPSNHSVNMFCIAFFLSSFFPKGRWVFISIAFLVAYSRVYNGVHYPLDVICGGMLGSFCGILGAEVTKKAVFKFEKTLEMRKRKEHG